MDIPEAVADVMMGASMREVAAGYRQRLLAGVGLGPEDVTADTFADEVKDFMRRFARHLGDRHAGDTRAGHALRDWILHCNDYEAWDALLSGFAFEGRESLVRRGRMLFPRTLTAHWPES